VSLLRGFLLLCGESESSLVFSFQGHVFACMSRSLRAAHVSTSAGSSPPAGAGTDECARDVLVCCCCRLFCSAPFVAFKTENSGDLAASSVERTAARIKRATVQTVNGTVQSKALSSGSYVFYQDASAAAIGIQTAPAGASNFRTMSECFLACDFDNSW
jgi:hypothetical protein